MQRDSLAENAQRFASARYSSSLGYEIGGNLAACCFMSCRADGDQIVKQVLPNRISPHAHFKPAMGPRGLAWLGVATGSARQWAGSTRRADIRARTTDPNSIETAVQALATPIAFRFPDHESSVARRYCGRVARRR